PLFGCLLEGVPEVLDLMGENPFPDKPPIFIRAQLYRYSFSALETKRKTGEWWTREYVTSYSPTYTLKVTRHPLRTTINRRPIQVAKNESERAGNVEASNE